MSIIPRLYKCDFCGKTEGSYLTGHPGHPIAWAVSGDLHACGACSEEFNQWWTKHQQWRDARYDAIRELKQKYRQLEEQETAAWDAANPEPYPQTKEEEQAKTVGDGNDG
jgi:hypothetical protein